MPSPQLEELFFGLPDLDTSCLSQQQQQQQQEQQEASSSFSYQHLQSLPLERYDSSGGQSFQSTTSYDSYPTAPINIGPWDSGSPSSPTATHMGSWDAVLSPYGSYDPNMNMLYPATAFRPSLTFDSHLTAPVSLSASPDMDYTISPTPSFDPSPNLPPVAPTSFPSLAIPELDLAAQHPYPPASAAAPPPAPSSRPRYAPHRYPSTLSTKNKTDHRHRASSHSTTIPCPHCPPQTPKNFKRRADLNRHIAHMHSIPTHNYSCDYTRCSRRHDPFHRRDHYRDHLREFHREDIEKRGVDESEEWYRGRNVVKAWWRCSRCLCRVSIGRSRFECHECGGVAGRKRQELRM
jgi:hypothetical protein